jgi:hypothetical protein
MPLVLAGTASHLRPVAGDSTEARRHRTPGLPRTPRMGPRFGARGPRAPDLTRPKGSIDGAPPERSGSNGASSSCPLHRLDHAPSTMSHAAAASPAQGRAIRQRSTRSGVPRRLRPLDRLSEHASLRSSRPRAGSSLHCPPASVRPSPAHFQRHVEIRGSDSFSCLERENAVRLGTRLPEGEASLT